VDGARRVRAVQTVVQQPPHGRLPHLGGVLPRRALGRVRAQQVVAHVPARRVLRQQMGAGQLGQQATDLARLAAREGRRGGRCDVRARVQGQQPQQPGRPRAQRAVRPRQHRPHVTGRVRVGERVEAAVGGAQVGRAGGEREVRARGGPRRDDGQRQRQPRAPGDDLVHGLRLGPHPLRAQPAGQHLTGLDGREPVQHHRTRPLRRHQPRQPVPARDDDETPRTPRQQRTHLLGVPRVVQHQQHPAPRQHTPVQPRLRLRPVRYAPRGHPERLQEPPQHLPRIRGHPTRAEPPQVRVELPVREVLRHSVRPPHGERRLPDTAHPADHRDAGARGLTRRQLPEAGEFGAAARERGQIGGELGGTDVGGADGARHTALGRAAFRYAVPRYAVLRYVRHQRQTPRPGGPLLTQHLPPGRPQFGPRRHPQLVRQPLPHPPPRVERRRPLTGRRERPHEPCLQRLVQRMLARRAVQDRQQPNARPRGQRHVRRLLQHRQILLLQRPERGMRTRLDGNTCRHGPGPQPQRLRQERHGSRRPPHPLLPGPPHQLAEVQQVEGARRRVEPVSARVPHQPPPSGPHRQIRLEEPPQHPHVPVHGVGRRGGRRLAPQRVLEFLHGHRPPRVRHQLCQQQPLLRRAQLRLDAFAAHAHRSQDLEPHRHVLIPVCPTSAPVAGPAGRPANPVPVR